MTYWDQATLSTDADFRQRIGACVSKEQGILLPGEHPLTWADRNQWDVAAQGNLAESYAYAVATSVPNPGRDVSVITDEALLAAVYAVLPIS